MSLKSRWSNTLASSPRFDTHIQAALNLRNQLPNTAGMTPSSPDSLTTTWLQPLTQNIGQHTLADPAYHTFDFINLDNMQTDTGEVLFGDMIDAEVDDVDEAPPPPTNEPLTLQDIPSHAIELQWELPVSVTQYLKFPVSMLSIYLVIPCSG